MSKNEKAQRTGRGPMNRKLPEAIRGRRVRGAARGGVGVLTPTLNVPIHVIVNGHGLQGQTAFAVAVPQHVLKVLGQCAKQLRYFEAGEAMRQLVP